MKKKKKFYETKEFIKLNKEWMQILYATGFKDIESETDKKNNSVIKQFIKVNRAFIIYYKKCLDYLHSGHIQDPLNLFIFEQHCNGISNYLISEKLSQLYKDECLDYLESDQIKDELDLFIFENHISGFSADEILEKLIDEDIRNFNGHNLTSDKISRRILRLLNEGQIYYRPLHSSNIDRRILKILKQANIQSISFRRV